MTESMLRTGGGEEGFSVIELLVVFTVVILAMTIALPRISASYEATRVDAAASRLAAALVRTRALSIREAEDRDFILDLRRRTYASDPTQAATVLERGISIAADQSDNAGRVVVRFRPDGRASGGRFILSKGRKKAAITIDWLTGRVRMHRTG